MNELKERIHENGIDYILCGDYYIPDWQIPQCDRTMDTTDECGRRILRSTVLLCMRDI